MKHSSRTWAYIKDFGETTTLHGIPWLVHSQLHWFEILMWGIVTGLSTAGSVIMIYNQWDRFYTNPTVISLQKDYRTWVIPLPAATVCYINKLNSTLAKKYIKKHWNVEEGEKFDHYMDFLSNVTNAKYGSLQHFHKYKDNEEFKGLNLEGVYNEVSVRMDFLATVFDPKYKNLTMIEITSELGFCYTYSGVLSQFLALQSHNMSYNFRPPNCNFLKSTCYGRIEELPADIFYYIHSPYETTDVREKSYIVLKMWERDTTWRFLETVASKDLRGLTPDQRRCRFIDEPLKGWNIPRYSYNVCLMECRRRLALQLCGCAPHFYKKRDDIPVCTLEGLACLAPHTNSIITLTHQGHSVKCKCYPACEDINFYVDKDDSREWYYPVPCNRQFRWAIEKYSKTRLKRDILFSFEDLLVSFGGTAALYLGCSLLTFIELTYFFGLRLFWFIYYSSEEDHLRLTQLDHNLGPQAWRRRKSEMLFKGDNSVEISKSFFRR